MEGKSGYGKGNANHALIIGKFSIVHAGHCFAIESALKLCTVLHICLCSKRDEMVPGEIRCEWIRETYGAEVKSGALVVHHITKEIQKAHADNPDAPAIWAREVRAHVGVDFDAVFGSENYGWELANHLHARFIPIDIDRRTVPVSSRAVYVNPAANWRYLPPATRFSLVRVIGAAGVKKHITRFAKALHASVYIPYAMRKSESLHDLNGAQGDVRRATQAELAVLKRMSEFVICVLLPAEYDDTQFVETQECEQVFEINSDDDFITALREARSLLALGIGLTKHQHENRYEM